MSDICAKEKSSGPILNPSDVTGPKVVQSSAGSTSASLPVGHFRQGQGHRTAEQRGHARRPLQGQALQVHRRGAATVFHIQLYIT